MEKKDKIQSICVNVPDMNIIFAKIKDRLLESNKKKSSFSKRQRYYEDYGVNGGQCCSRHDKLTEISGISKPLLLTGSKDPFVTKVIVWASDIIEMYCPWIWKGISDERQDLFAKNIHKNNKYIEGCRFTVYYYDLNDCENTKQSLCTLHIDSQNGKDDDLSRVFIISKMIWEKQFTKGWRVSIICYTRHAVTSYMKRKNETIGPAITYLINNYMEFPAMRRSVTGLS